MILSDNERKKGIQLFTYIEQLRKQGLEDLRKGIHLQVEDFFSSNEAKSRKSNSTVGVVLD